MNKQDYDNAARELRKFRVLIRGPRLTNLVNKMNVGLKSVGYSAQEARKALKGLAKYIN